MLNKKSINSAFRFAVKPCCTLLSLLLLLTGCAAGPGDSVASRSGWFSGAAAQGGNPVSRTGLYFDTAVEITIYGMEEARANELLSECMDLAAHYDKDLFSAYVPTSLLSSLNRDCVLSVAHGSDPDFLRLLEMSLDLERETDGAFSPCLGGLSMIWNFTGDPPGPVPPADEIRQALTHTDSSTIRIAEGAGQLLSFDALPEAGDFVFTTANDPGAAAGSDFAFTAPDDPGAAAGSDPVFTTADDPGAAAGSDPAAGGDDGFLITLTDVGLMLDLGGIAKGFTADRIKDRLLEAGVSSAIINLGGNVLLVGSKPDGSDFRVGIRDPESAADAGGTEHITRTVTLSDRSVVTSGTYERYFEEDGVRYHHILDPATGYPADSGLVSVTVISADSANGDALATACLVLGQQKGQALIERLPGTEALFIAADGTETRTAGFPAQ